MKTSLAWAVSIITFAFMFMPEDLFKLYKLIPAASDAINVIVNRLILFLAILLLSIIVRVIHLRFRNKVVIKGKNYTIIVRYGNIFKQKNCKKVIPFDECFSTSVGSAPSDINPSSICGQYLKENPSVNIAKLLSDAKLPVKGKSKYKETSRYESGKIIPNREYLLMAFAKLDKDGLGRMTRSEYIDCLAILWEELDKYYGQQDVCIPVIGSGVTRFGDTELTQQELLDIIIDSYRLTGKKIKKPNKLCIVCRRRDDFSINKIGVS